MITLKSMNLKSKSSSGRQRSMDQQESVDQNSKPASHATDHDAAAIQPMTPSNGNQSASRGLLGARGGTGPIFKNALRPSISGSSVSRSQSQPPSLRAGSTSSSTGARTLRSLLSASGHPSTPATENPPPEPTDVTSHVEGPRSKMIPSADPQTLVSKVSLKVTEAVARVFISDTPGNAPSLLHQNNGLYNGVTVPRPQKSKEAGDLISSEIRQAVRQLDQPSVRVLLRSAIVRGLSLFVTNLKQCMSTVSLHRHARSPSGSNAPVSTRVPMAPKDVDSLDPSLRFEIEVLRTALYMKMALVSVAKDPASPSFVKDGLRSWISQLDSAINYIAEPILQAFVAKISAITERLAYPGTNSSSSSTESTNTSLSSSRSTPSSPVASISSSLANGLSVSSSSDSKSLNVNALDTWMRDLSSLLDAASKLINKMDVGVDGQIWLIRIGVAATWRVIIHTSTLPLFEPELSPLTLTNEKNSQGSKEDAAIAQSASQQQSAVAQALSAPLSASQAPAKAYADSALSTHASTSGVPRSGPSAPLFKAKKAAAAVTSVHLPTGNSQGFADAISLPGTPRVGASSQTLPPLTSLNPTSTPHSWVPLPRIITDLRFIENKILSFTAQAGFNPNDVPEDVVLRSLCNDPTQCMYCKLNRRFGDDANADDDDAPNAALQSRLELAYDAMFEAAQSLSSMIVLLGASADPVVLLASLRAAVYEDAQDRLSSQVNIPTSGADKSSPSAQKIAPADLLDLKHTDSFQSVEADKVMQHNEHWPPAKPACATVAAALDVVPTIVLTNVISRRVPLSARLKLVNEYWGTPWVNFARQELPTFVEAEKYAQEYIDELAHQLRSLKLPQPWSDIMHEVLKIEPN